MAIDTRIPLMGRNYQDFDNLQADTLYKNAQASALKNKGFDFNTAYETAMMKRAAGLPLDPQDRAAIGAKNDIESAKPYYNPVDGTSSPYKPINIDAFEQVAQAVGVAAPQPIRSERTGLGYPNAAQVTQSELPPVGRTPNFNGGIKAPAFGGDDIFSQAMNGNPSANLPNEIDPYEALYAKAGGNNNLEPMPELTTKSPPPAPIQLPPSTNPRQAQTKYEAEADIAKASNLESIKDFYNRGLEDFKKGNDVDKKRLELLLEKESAIAKTEQGRANIAKATQPVLKTLWEANEELKGLGAILDKDIKNPQFGTKLKTKAGQLNPQILSAQMKGRRAARDLFPLKSGIIDGNVAGVSKTMDTPAELESAMRAIFDPNGTWQNNSDYINSVAQQLGLPSFGNKQQSPDGVIIKNKKGEQFFKSPNGELFKWQED
jgi:hypothetical protein